eukprot:TRINITY_DN2676_c0_g1_i1.p1 TRINITY_DN2676_c0_g1~~TRINITY_DN2676_c0_g1_i1.p1  ORF type:complete len:745 (-),score=230.55 TRINITY_DN2676_c0_g1_i1:2726-4891(-)
MNSILAYLIGSNVTYQLADEDCSIGRNPNNDIQLNSRSVSGDHCIISVSENGNDALLRDLDSRNGTFVNDLRVQNSTVRLFSGDTIKFGYDIHTFKFELTSANKKKRLNQATVDHATFGLQSNEETIGVKTINELNNKSKPQSPSKEYESKSPKIIERLPNILNGRSMWAKESMYDAQEDKLKEKPHHSSVKRVFPEPKIFIPSSDGPKQYFASVSQSTDEKEIEPVENSTFVNTEAIKMIEQPSDIVDEFVKYPELSTSSAASFADSDVQNSLEKRFDDLQTFLKSTNERLSSIEGYTKEKSQKSNEDQMNRSRQKVSFSDNSPRSVDFRTDKMKEQSQSESSSKQTLTQTEPQIETPSLKFEAKLETDASEEEEIIEEVYCHDEGVQTMFSTTEKEVQQNLFFELEELHIIHSSVDELMKKIISDTKIHKSFGNFSYPETFNNNNDYTLIINETINKLKMLNSSLIRFDCETKEKGLQYEDIGIIFEIEQIRKENEELRISNHQMKKKLEKKICLIEKYQKQLEYNENLNQITELIENNEVLTKKNLELEKILNLQNSFTNNKENKKNTDDNQFAINKYYKNLQEENLQLKETVKEFENNFSRSNQSWNSLYSQIETLKSDRNQLQELLKDSRAKNQLQEQKNSMELQKYYSKLLGMASNNQNSMYDQLKLLIRKVFEIEEKNRLLLTYNQELKVGFQIAYQKLNDNFLRSLHNLFCLF